MVTIKNDQLIVDISLEGAEMTSIRNAQTGEEYLWQGDDKYWGRQAPVLFPIVGRLIDNQYQYNGKTYTMNQHGFARDMTFTEQMVTSNSATFYLKSSPETLEKYPFEFSFQITYILHENQITVSYEILNPSNETIYYSVGGHPAFNVSQIVNEKGNDEFDQVYLAFKPAGQYLRIPLNKAGFTRRELAKYELIDHKPLTHNTLEMMP